MSTYTQILYQIVFTTKNRKGTLSKEKRKILYAYIWSILKNKKCYLYRIGGVEDHIHIVFSLHPSIALATLIKDLKISSSIFIKNNKLFDDFEGWQLGYSAFTYSISAKENLIKYVINQEEHHAKKSYQDEFYNLLKEHQLELSSYDQEN